MILKEKPMKELLVRYHDLRLQNDSIYILEGTNIGNSHYNGNKQAEFKLQFLGVSR